MVREAWTIYIIVESMNGKERRRTREAAVKYLFGGEGTHTFTFLFFFLFFFPLPFGCPQPYRSKTRVAHPIEGKKTHRTFF